MGTELDQRTRDLFEALASPGASMLYALVVSGAATERQLVEQTGAAQATANRRLAELERLGVLERRDAGQRHTPNRRWSLRHREGVRALLLAAVELSQSGADEEATTRGEALRSLRQASGEIRRIRKK